MEEPRHRFRITVAAAVLLPVTTVLVSTSSTPAALPVADSARATSPTPTSGQQAERAPVVRTGAKLPPPGYGHRPGNATVITQTVAQRVAAASAITSLDIPSVALEAYRRAAASVDSTDPVCHLGWPVLAAIGQVESDQGRYGGSTVLANGDVTPVILGPVLDGANHMAGISDTDNGQYDGNTAWDRAVGPMQFIPSTWAVAGADGNGDGIRDPNNYFDAALAAAGYLCAGSTNFSVPASARSAIFRYNHSAEYVDVVLRLAKAYAEGDVAVVDGGSTAGAAATAATAVRQRSAQPPAHRPPAQPPHRHRSQQPPQQKPPGHHQPPRQPPGHHRPPHQHPPPLPVLRPCHAGWCFDKTPLDLGKSPNLDVVEGDYNLDGTAQTVQDELTTMSGLPVQVTVVPDPQVDPPSAAASTDGERVTEQAAQHVELVRLTVDEDGLVLSINGLAYEYQPLITPVSPPATTNAS